MAYDFMENIMHLLLDLETLGTNHNSVIASIGAVLVCPGELKIVGEFYQSVDIQSCLDRGLTVNGSTINFWLKQNPDVISETFKDKGGTRSLTDSLSRFYDFLSQNVPNLGNLKVWGNGSDFDNVIISNAFKAHQLETPWPFYNNRCLRTLKNQYSFLKVTDPILKHHALHDAIHEAELLIKIIKYQKENGHPVSQ